MSLCATLTARATQRPPELLPLCGMRQPKQIWIDISQELVFVFAIAIIVGAVVGIGLTVLLMPRAKACKDCVPKECSGRPAQLDGQRICPQLAEFTKVLRII